MVVDCILDRKDGVPYSPRDFYFRMLGYTQGKEISKAMDFGTELDVKKSLARYIINNDYNPEIITYIYSVNWIAE